ncbi:molybdenum cofactor guanylyltransferase [Bacillus sp. 1P06AnD]|uniref:molybdenum cofactor guanylyltransferase n=1 Tax=Bacillus sp. 1P06AnD TaxID=3132208 RepID=UPI0039A118ED
MECTAIILAGGKSSRMGRNKALLPIFNQTVIEHIASRCQLVADEVILVTNDPETYSFLGLPMVADRYGKSGPMAGLEAGLTASSHDVGLLVACDMPFLDEQVMRALTAGIVGHDAAVPVIEGRKHPLFAAYRKTCLKTIREKLLARDVKMMHLLDDVQVKELFEEDLALSDESKMAFFNMNSPDEYKKAQEVERKWYRDDR